MHETLAKSLRPVRSVMVAALLAVLGGCKATPICVLPPRHSFRISEAEIPGPILASFHKTSGGAEILRSELYIAGDRLVFYVFRFRSGGRLQETLVAPSGKVEMSYEVSGQEKIEQ